MARALSAHFLTLGRDIFNVREMWAIVSPAAKRHRIRARCTSRAGLPREWLNRVNSSFCSAVRISFVRLDFPAMIQHSAKQIRWKCFIETIY
jgi:hypothetical protein